MSELWRSVSLGEVFESSNVKLGAHVDEPTVFSISKHTGVLPADKYHARRMASQDLDGYKWLRSDWWLYSTIHIDEGSIARNSTGYDGVVSPMYTVMKWIGDHDDPAYFEILLRSPMMLARYADSAKGSVNRRKSLSFKAFSAMRVAVPPLSAQRRAVEVVAELESAEQAANETARALRMLRAAVSGALLAGEHEIPEAFDSLIESIA